MSRTLFLLVYPSRLFPAHWSLWLPTTRNSNLGKRIHAVGDAGSGFQFVVDRNYDLALSEEGYPGHVLPLAEMDEGNVVDDVPDQSPVRESAASMSDPEEGLVGTGDGTLLLRPRDRIEEVASSIPTPGKSLRSAVTMVNGSPDTVSS